MKKFCNKCGNQLDLGLKTCLACNAFNPYFIAGFTTADERVTKPGLIFSKQQVTPSSVILQNPEGAELEMLRQKQAEQQRSEQELKSELLKVKEEAEQYKKQTFDLVKEVQKELHEIEQENKLLNQKVESLKSNVAASPQVTTAAQPHVFVSKNESKKGVTALAAIVLLLVATGVSYFFFNASAKKQDSALANAAVKPGSADVYVKKAESNPDIATNPQSSKKLLAAVSSPAVAIAPKAVPVTPTAVSQPKALPEVFSLTEARLKADLVGKKLSGCDITINSLGEINSVSNLVLVDRLSASYLKYKCIVKVKQGADVFTSSPYIYYSAGGTFIKIDGTNCE